MQEEYPKVVSEWESATIEMEPLSLQLKKRLEQQEQLIDMLEKVRISIASKDNSLDDPKSLHIQKSLHKEKYSKLEKELESLKHAVLNAKAREKNAQIYLFNEAFSDHSIKCIERTCRQNMERLQHNLAIAQSMMDAKRKQLEVSTSYSEKFSLREEVSRLADNIEYKKFDMKTKSKILELCTILHSGISVRDQWCNAQQNYDELTIKIKKNEKDDLLLGKRDRDRMKILQAELLKRRDRELKTLQAFRSILTKIDMVESCVNESNPQEDKESNPQENKESKPEKQSIICKQDNQHREDYTDQRELELEEENVEYSQNERPNFSLVTYESVNYSENTSNQHEDKESILEKQSANIICKKENIRDDYTDSKELKLEEENLEDNQNKQKNSKLSNERFQNEYGIIIESISQTDLSYDVKVWDSDERLKVVESKVFPDGFMLDTDIFYIKESTVGNSQGNEQRVVRDVLLKVLRPMENNLYYEYKGAVKFGNAWRLIDCICQDMYMVFKVKEVESFCVLSFVRQEKSTVLPPGSQFISEIDNRIQVTFPPNAVSKETQLSFKIHPVNTKFILERITDPPNDEVYAITSSLSTTHMKFKKMFKVQLPLFTISNLCHEPEYINYNILKWNDTGLFQVTDIQPVISNGLVCFETNSFSGYCCVGTTRPQISSSLESFVPEIYGLRKWCKILFFVGKISNNNIPIMLECVEVQRVSEVCEKRKNNGYHFVSEWISRDLFFTPNSTIITVEVKGRFKVPKESSVRLPRLSFIPVARDNFSHFLVELGGTTGVAYGLLSLRVERKVLYEIYYYPDSPKQPSVPLIKVWNPIVKEFDTKMKGEEENKGVQVNITPNFFTEKGLLSLSKQMSPDTMLSVWVHMNIPVSEYEKMRQTYGDTTLGNLKILQTALDQQSQNSKLHLILEALKEAGEEELAEKVEYLHSNKKPLHTI